MSTLVRLQAREILDSRGFPTVEVEANLEDGSIGRASVPSGASTGSHESLELRDGDQERFSGKGVLKAVEHVTDVLAPALAEIDPFNQIALDEKMITEDGSAALQNLGANAVLGVSLAISKAAAASLKLPYFQYIQQVYNQVIADSQLAVKTLNGYTMPIPMFNIMNGGAHTNWQTTDFQEFMILPTAANSFKMALEQGSEIYHQLKKVLQAKNLSTLVGDEGGFAPNIKGNQQALDLIMEAIQAAGYQPRQDINIGMDAATSELYKEGMYQLKIEGLTYTTHDMIDLWHEWVGKYPIVSLEDGLAEDDWSGWMEMGKSLGDRILLVGDDLLVTNTERIHRAIDTKACNALLMKVNQIGTLTESLRAVILARSAGWKIVVSHRSGETEDTSIADIAVGINAEYVKMGAPARSERTAKYNQLLRIEEQITQQ